MEVQEFLFGVDRDLIAVFDEGDRAAPVLAYFTEFSFSLQLSFLKIF